MALKVPGERVFATLDWKVSHSESQEKGGFQRPVVYEGDLWWAKHECHENTKVLTSFFSRVMNIFIYKLSRKELSPILMIVILTKSEFVQSWWPSFLSMFRLISQPLDSASSSHGEKIRWNGMSSSCKY